MINKKVCLGFLLSLSIWGRESLGDENACAQAISSSELVDRTGIDGNLVKQGINTIRENGVIALSLVEGEHYGAQVKREDGLRDLMVKVELMPEALSEHKLTRQPPEQISLYFAPYLARGGEWSKPILFMRQTDLSPSTSALYRGSVKFFGREVQLILRSDELGQVELPRHFNLLLSDAGSPANPLVVGQ